MTTEAASKPIETIFRTYIKTDPRGAARALEQLKSAEAAQILATHPVRLIIPVFEQLIPHFSAEILDSLSPEIRSKILGGLPKRQAVRILRYMNEESRQRVFSLLTEKETKLLLQLLDYPPDTAGGIMDTQFVSVLLTATVQQTVQIIRKAQRKVVGYVYVIDEEGKLVGVISIRDLLLAKTHDLIEPLIHRDVRKVQAQNNREELALIIQESRFLALPVVDDEDHLVGVVRHEQAVRAIQKDILGDLSRMVGSDAEEHSLAPVSIVVKRRLPWLMVNLLTAFMAAAVVSLFEGIIAKVTALAVLLPIVAGQGGNTGAQALAIVIRGLALREILPGMVLRVLYKEMVAGAFNGFIIAIVTAGAVLLWSQSWVLSLVIGLAMVVNMVAAALAGASIPLILQKLGRDPAQSSSIFMTTVTDIVGFATFLGFAMIFFSIFK
ncbi:magnesium transporter [candidate division CSSED10-310 bacterium]|uniref:Magnesium transporter MgtE n=1 Tax=candidate division CSSED10-310 bacterium TaxID=2855610 RepID=A0ABV6YXB2_UNCC1